VANKKAQPTAALSKTIPAALVNSHLPLGDDAHWLTCGNAFQMIDDIVTEEFWDCNHAGTPFNGCWSGAAR
jgi:hypothetical protein